MRRTALWTAFFILLAVTAIVGWSSLQQADRLTAVEARLDAVKGRVTDLGTEVDTLRSRLEALVADSARMDEERSVSVPLYYIQTTEEGTDYRVVRVERTVPLRETTPEQIEVAFAALVAGPTPEELEAHADNLSNLIPGDAQLKEVRIEDGTAILNLSKEFERVGGTARIDGMLQQLTYTMTAFDGIEQVRLLVEGERVGTVERPFTGDGFLFNALRREAPQDPMR